MERWSRRARGSRGNVRCIAAAAIASLGWSRQDGADEQQRKEKEFGSFHNVNFRLDNLSY